MKLLAIDVAKAELVNFDGVQVTDAVNRLKEIRALLQKHPGACIALEPTSTYHMQVADLAYEQGRTVYLVNPRDLKHYRESRSFRAKNDRIDAEVLYSYVTKHSEELRPWKPLSQDLRKLKEAITHWFHAVQMRSRLAQIWEGHSPPQAANAIRELEELARVCQEEAIALAQLVDAEGYKRNLSAAGVGPLCACCFTFLFNSKEFESPDAVRAFVGLDLKVADSGNKRGKRILTKRGDRILRYAITCAGRGLLNSRLGKKVNEQLKQQGRKMPERLVIAARKVIRTVYQLNKLQTQFDPNKFSWRLDTKT